MKIRLLIIIPVIFISCSTFQIPSPSKNPSEQTEAEYSKIEEGIQLHDEGKFREAIEIYEEILKENPDNIFALHELAYSYFAIQEYEKSTTIAMKGTEYFSDVLAQFYVLAGNGFDEQGKVDEAIELYQKAIEIQPLNYLTYYNLSIALMNKGNIEEAKINLLKALKYNPNHPSSNLALVEMLMDEGKQIQSLLLVCRFLILEPTSQRTVKGINYLNNLLYAGVERENEQKINLNMFLQDDEENTFSMMEFSLKAKIAIQLSDTLKLSEILNRVDIFETLLSILDEPDKEYSSDIANYLLPYFNELKQNNYTETFVYAMHQLADEKDIVTWIEENEDKLNDFYNWSNNYTWEY